MSWGEKQAIVIDNGTGYTKMGYAGNSEPSFIIPTAVATSNKSDGVSDLDFFIGDDAVSRSSTYALNYPIRHGLIENWDNMEKLWHRCFYDHLRVEPEEHYVTLTEPPLNPPENREYTAEVMFETFNVPGMYIAVQAILALAASWFGKSDPKDHTLTGTVIDSGDGVTHVIPVAEGYVIGSAIRHIPLAGRDITEFVMRSLRERGEPVLPEDIREVAKAIKEEHCYVSKDLAEEYTEYDVSPAKMFRKFMWRKGTSKAYTVDVGYERFLGPELFFNPEIYSSDFTKPLPEIVDEAVLASPIDSRRALYSNIVLSGGSTMFKNFHRRLQQDISTRVKDRIAANYAKHKHAGVPPEMKVKVHTHDLQRYAVWFGGSYLSSNPAFYKVCHTKAQYQEEGPRIARHNPVFSVTM